MYTTNKKENYNVFSYTKRDSVFTLLFKDGIEKSVHFPLRCELHGIVSCCIGRSRVEAWIMIYLARPGRGDWRQVPAEINVMAAHNTIQR